MIRSISKKRKHRRTIINRRRKHIVIFHLHHLHTHRANRMRINVQMPRLVQHPILHPRRIGQPHNLIRIITCHTRRRHLCQCRRASIRHQPPLALHQLGNTRPHRIHQLIQMHIRLRGFHHRFTHLGQHQRTTDNRICPATVNQRPHTN